MNRTLTQNRTLPLPLPADAQMDTAVPLRQELLTHLLALSFPAFAACVADLLQSMGYTDIRLAGRSGRKGKNRDGGYDLEATAPTGLSRRRVVAQLKQFTPEQKVHQRTLDELRGAALRAGAAEALLITTGSFSYVVQDHFAAAHRSRSTLLPAQGIDGDRLVDLLIQHQVGVTAEGRVDTAYFAARAAARRMPSPATPQASGAGRGGQGRSLVRGRRHPLPATLVVQVTLPVLFHMARMEEPKGRAGRP